MYYDKNIPIHFLAPFSCFGYVNNHIYVVQQVNTT